jgi:hypothetical protein
VRIQLSQAAPADYNGRKFRVRKLLVEAFSMIGQTVSHYRIIEKIGQ